MLNPDEARGRGGKDSEVRIGAKILPWDDESSDLGRVAWELLFLGSIDETGSIGDIASNSSTVLASKSLTPDELAASIRGSTLWSFSNLPTALD